MESLKNLIHSRAMRRVAFYLHLVGSEVRFRKGFSEHITGLLTRNESRVPYDIQTRSVSVTGSNTACGRNIDPLEESVLRSSIFSLRVNTGEMTCVA